MKDLGLIFDDGRFETTSRVIAENCGVQHVAALKLIKRYQRELSGVGAHAKLILRAFKTKGRAGEEAVLDERQTIFLISLMKNSPSVVKYKENVVTAFFKESETTASLAAEVVGVRFPGLFPGFGEAGADKEVAQ